MLHLRVQGKIRRQPEIDFRTIVEMAYQLVPGMECLHEIIAR